MKKKTTAKLEQKPTIKGYKIFDKDFKCKDFQFEEGKTYTHTGRLEICSSGFHFCLKASNCFSYYAFDPQNIVCEVEALGEVQTHSEDTKCCTNKIKIVRRLKWDEVLLIANEGANNTGHSNSGYRNSGYRNSGNSNSGDSNSGNWNSGNWNSGNCNSGDSNSGNWNSGNWNSGNCNSGDCNSGYRNSGAFCTDNNPKVYLFDKPTKMLVREWEQSRAYRIMSNLNFTFWINSNMMSKEEKESNHKHETTGGYLKTIPYKEGWKNMWGNLSDEDKKAFTDLENFSGEKFEEITGIKIK